MIQFENFRSLRMPDKMKKNPSKKEDGQSTVSLQIQFPS